MLLKHRREWIANRKAVQMAIDFISQLPKEEINHKVQIPHDAESTG
jgi:hypothetical protein